MGSYGNDFDTADRARQGSRRLRPVALAGPWLLLVVLSGVGGAFFAVETVNPQGGIGALGPSVWCLLGALLLAALWLVAAKGLKARAQWSKSAEVGDYQSVATPLLSSATPPKSAWRHHEYCLILRPFGSDGVTLCIGHPERRRFSLIFSPTPTLEQVIDLEVRRSLGIKTLAIVNQDVRWAPNGPDYLSCPHDDWRRQVGKLIRNSHTIFLLLPPGQEIRDSLHWELEQVTRHGFNDRVVVVLPHPWNNHSNGLYQKGRRSAARIMALFEKYFGTFDEVTSMDVDMHEKVIPPGTVFVKQTRVGRASADERTCFRFGIIHGIAKTKRPLSFPYTLSVRQMLNIRAAEMEGLGWRERYPWR